MRGPDADIHFSVSCCFKRQLGGTLFYLNSRPVYTTWKDVFRGYNTRACNQVVSISGVINHGNIMIRVTIKSH